MIYVWSSTYEYVIIFGKYKNEKVWSTEKPTESKRYGNSDPHHTVLLKSHVQPAVSSKKSRANSQNWQHLTNQHS